MHELTEQIQKEIRKVIIGKDDVIRKVLMAVLAQGHVLLAVAFDLGIGPF